MGIIVNPTLPPPAPPVTATSPDGVLRATLDPDWAGVELRAEFASLLAGNLLANGAFTAGIAGWTPYAYAGNATLAAAGGKLAVSWTAGTVSAGAYTSLATPIPTGVAVKVRFTLGFPAPPSSDAIARLALDTGSGNAYRTYDLPVLTGGHTYTVNTVIPDGTTLARIYVYLRNGMAAAGQMTIDDVSVTAAVEEVRFWRHNPDGTVEPVRSGDTAPALGRVAYAYDQEAPLNAAVLWHADALTQGRVIASSASVGIAVPAESVAWLKSVEDPGLAGTFTISTPQDSQRSAVVDLAQIRGRAAPVAAFDVLGAMTGSIVVQTGSRAEYDLLLELLASGVWVLQGSDRHAFPADTLYAVATSVTPARPDDMPGWDIRFVSVEWQQVDRPDTTGQPLRIPGRSYAHRADTWPTYSVVPARTYAAAIA